MASSLQNTSSLTINVEDLLNVQGVEKQRVEFKKSWKGSKQGKGPGTYWQVLHTICAFANDFYNDNGGYIIIGVEEEDNTSAGKKRQAVLPPCGIPGSDFDRIQKEIMGACRAHIKPNFLPILSPEVVQGVQVLVIWTMASDSGPHQCRETEKGSWRHYIRQGPETKKASPEEVTQLIEQSRKTPFDDRMAKDYQTGLQLSISDIDHQLVNSFLEAVRSKLRGQSAVHQMTLYQKMNLVIKYGDCKVDGKVEPNYIPRNVALLFFNPNPEKHFSGARIEVARYTRDKEVIEDKTLTGPIDQQINECLKCILQQTSDEVSYACLTYPERALREAVVNAVYHRGYESDNCEPIKVHIRPDRIEIVSYPGPHSYLKIEHFQDGIDIPSVPARNRRIGEILKELKLAEARGTGVNTIFKTMKSHENPPPAFLFDASFFQVTLPAHPKYTTNTLLADVDHLVAKGEKSEAVELLIKFLDKNPNMHSDNLVFKLLELHNWRLDHPNVLKHRNYLVEHFNGFQDRSPLVEELQAWSAGKATDVNAGVRIIKALVKKEAKPVELRIATLKAVKLCGNINDLKSIQTAHKLFEAMGPTMIASSSKLAYEYGSCKYHIYRLNKNQRDAQHGASSGLFSYLLEADEYLKKAVQLTNKECRNAIAYQYRMLGQVHLELHRLDKSTASNVNKYYQKAREMKPDIHICNSLIPRWKIPKSKSDSRGSRRK